VRGCSPLCRFTQRAPSSGPQTELPTNSPFIEMHQSYSRFGRSRLLHPDVPALLGKGTGPECRSPYAADVSARCPVRSTAFAGGFFWCRCSGPQAVATGAAIVAVPAVEFWQRFGGQSRFETAGIVVSCPCARKGASGTPVRAHQRADRRRVP